MPTEKKRIMLTDDGVTIDLLARDHTATGVALALSEYAGLLAAASREIEDTFNRAEWNLMADALNGCLELHDLTGGITYGTLIYAEIADGCSISGLAVKWLDNDPKKASTAAKDLLRRIEALSPIHHAAIAASVRWFWANSDKIDHECDDWWRVGFRRWRERDTPIGG